MPMPYAALLLAGLSLVILSALAIGLGFIALLKQKSYIDVNTQKVTSVEIPLFGKMKANYPALFFLFLGGLLAFLAAPRLDNLLKVAGDVEQWTSTELWYIDGRLFIPEEGAEAPDWSATEIVVIPQSVNWQFVRPDGRYELRMDLPRWQTFDRYIGAVTFEVGGYVGKIAPQGADNTAEKENEHGRFVTYDVCMEERSGGSRCRGR